MIGDETISANNVAPQPPPTSRPPRDFQAESPLVKMTINLLDTYKRINEHYYEAKRKKQEQLAKTQSTTINEGVDDQESDYIINQGDELGERKYRIERRIGKGSFGQVVCATERDTKVEVAIKIIKSKKAFTTQAKEEMRLLRLLNANDNPERGSVVRLIDSFMHKGHQCLVFEKLSMNLYDLLRNTKFEGVSFDLIRKFARQILVALKFFASLGVIHCDLKPENILLCDNRRSTLKIIDFGSSCTIDNRPYSYIQSRFYRSPEVILGCEYTTAIDMWSLGCILIEMHSGEPLFSGQNEKEQVYLLCGSRGMPPESMLKAGKKTPQFFDEIIDETTSTHTWKLKELKERPERSRPLNPLTIEQALGIAPNSPVSAPFIRKNMKKDRRDDDEKRGRREEEMSAAKYKEFADFLKCMLTYSPSERISPENALLHPFLQTDLLLMERTLHHTKSMRTDQPKRPLSQ